MSYKQFSSYQNMNQRYDKIGSPAYGELVTNQMGRPSNGFPSRNPRLSPRKIRISKIFRTPSKIDSPTRISRPTSPIFHRPYRCQEYPISPCHSYPNPRPISRPLSPPPDHRYMTSERSLQTQRSIQKRRTNKKKKKHIDRITFDCLEDQVYLSYIACKELFPITACIGATTLCCLIL